MVMSRFRVEDERDTEEQDNRQKERAKNHESRVPRGKREKLQGGGSNNVRHYYQRKIMVNRKYKLRW